MTLDSRAIAFEVLVAVHRNSTSKHGFADCYCNMTGSARYWSVGGAGADVTLSRLFFSMLDLCVLRIDSGFQPRTDGNK
jgi:hypothetical protein